MHIQIKVVCHTLIGKGTTFLKNGTLYNTIYSSTDLNNRIFYRYMKLCSMCYAKGGYFHPLIRFSWLMI